MNLNNLTKVKEVSNKRLGRGIGSGRGKTSGKGTKGQKARGKVPAGFTSGALPLYKKLPLNRGWGNRKAAVSAIVLTLDALNVYNAKAVVDLSSLIEQKIVLAKDARKKGVKILAKGELKKALTVKVPVSRKAGEMIEMAGGKVE